MLALSSVSISFGQDLKEHQWENRVLLILSDDGALVKKQIEILQKKSEGLKERKLIIYRIYPKEYFKGINNHHASFPSNYSQLKKKKKNLEIVLIGLDGGVKLRQTELLDLEKLFTLIDGMPMRRQELKN